MRRFFALFITFILLFSLVSCGTGKQEVNSAGETVGSSSVGSVESSSGVSVESIIDDRRSDEPVIPIKCFEKECIIRNIFLSGKAKILMQYGVMADEPADTETEYLWYLALIDIEKDEVLRECRTRDAFELLLGVRPNGEIVTCDGIYENTLSFYSEDMTYSRSVDIPADCYGLTYDRGKDRFYSFNEDTVFFIGTDGSVEDSISFGKGNTVSVYDSDSGLAVYEKNGIGTDDKREFVLYDTVNRRTVLEYGGQTSPEVNAEAMTVLKAVTASLVYPKKEGRDDLLPPQDSGL